MDETSDDKLITGLKLLGDLRFEALDTDDVPVSAVVLVKVRDTEGDTGWWARVSKGAQTHEILGALVSYTDRRRREEADEWLDDDE